MFNDNTQTLNKVDDAPDVGIEMSVHRFTRIGFAESLPKSPATDIGQRMIRISALSQPRQQYVIFLSVLRKVVLEYLHFLLNDRACAHAFDL
jgi:hypothetical protein